MSTTNTSAQTTGRAVQQLSLFKHKIVSYKSQLQMRAGTDLSYKWRAVNKYFGSKGECRHRDTEEEQRTASAAAPRLRPAPAGRAMACAALGGSRANGILTNRLLVREKGNHSPVTSFISLQPLLSPRKSLLIYCIERRIKLSLFHCKATSPPKSRAVHLTGTPILPLPGDYVSGNIPKTLRSIVPSISYYSLDRTKKECNCVQWPNQWRRRTNKNP